MANQSVTISLSGLKETIVRHINVFAKRYSEQGENKFTFVALGTAEEDLLGDFALKAAHEAVSHISQLVTAYASGDSITITATNSRWGVLNTTFKDLIEDYCVTMAVADYFGLYFPNQANYCLNRANSILSSILRVCYSKNDDIVSDGTPSYGTVEVE